MTNMNDIENATKDYAASRSALIAEVDRINHEIETIKLAHRKRLQLLAERTKANRAALSDLVEAAPELFHKPRTVTFFGITVGLRKGTGAVTFADEASVIKLIKSKLGFVADRLIKTTEKIQKGMLKKLSVKELARIGCAVESTGDVVLIKAADTEVEEYVSTLLMEAPTEK